MLWADNCKYKRNEKKKWWLGDRTADFPNMNWVASPCHYLSRGWFHGNLQRALDFTDVACAHVTCQCHPDYIGDAFRWIQASSASVRWYNLSNMYHKCQSWIERLTRIYVAVLGLGRNREKGTNLWKGMCGDVTRQVSSRVVGKCVRSKESCHETETWQNGYKEGGGHQWSWETAWKGIEWLKGCQNLAEKAMIR